MANFEYATQFFGFTPKAFVNGIYNAVNDYIKVFFKEVGEVLSAEFAKEDEIVSSKIVEVCKQLIEKCYHSVDKNIDKLEIYLLKNIFVVPPWVLLPEDEAHKSNVGKDECSLDQEIWELKTQILMETCFREEMQNEEKRLRKILAEVKRLENFFEDACIEANTVKETSDLIQTSCVKIIDILEDKNKIKD